MTKKEFNSFLENPRLGWDYLQGYYRLFVDLWLPFLLRERTRRLFLYRLVFTTARACVSNGACLCCGCKAPAVLWASRACSADNIVCKEQLGLNKCYEKMSKENLEGVEMLLGASNINKVFLTHKKLNREIRKSWLSKLYNIIRPK